MGDKNYIDAKDALSRGPDVANVRLGAAHEVDEMAMCTLAHIAADARAATVGTTKTDTLRFVLARVARDSTIHEAVMAYAATLADPTVQAGVAALIARLGGSVPVSAPVASKGRKARKGGAV
jgi:hypothetical protein